MYHGKEGQTFERVNDGAVRIEQKDPKTGAISTVHYNALQWAEIVADVSVAGSSPERIQQAAQFHLGG